MSLRTVLIVLALLPTWVGAGEKVRIEHRPSHLDVNTQLADAWLSVQRGDLLVALMQYREVLRGDERNRDALLGLASVALQQNDDRLAENYFSRALVLDPRDPVAHAGLALLSHGYGPESSLKLLADQYPGSAVLHFALGKLYGEQGRWNDARTAFEQAHQLAPESAVPQLNLAICFDHLNQPRAAADNYQRALELDASGRAFDHTAIKQRLQQLDPEHHVDH